MKHETGMKWNDEMVEEAIKEVVKKLNINHFPTHSEMEKVFGNKALTNKVSDKGTIFWAEKLGLPLKESETKLGNSYEVYAISDILKNTELFSIQTSTRHPYDLLTDNRVKIDVKVSKGFINNCNAKAYTFNLEKKEPTCDIYLLYCLNDETGDVEKTLIVPANLLLGQTQIGVGKVSKWDKFANRWDYISKISEFYRNLT